MRRMRMTGWSADSLVADWDNVGDSESDVTLKDPKRHKLQLSRIGDRIAFLVLTDLWHNQLKPSLVTSSSSIPFT